MLFASGIHAERKDDDMNWAIHTKGPTAAADLRAALESELDAFLGSEEAEAARQAQIASVKATADSMPAGEAQASLLLAHATLSSAAPKGIADSALRSAIAGQAKRGITAACDLALGTVNVTVSGSASRIDEDIAERLSVQLDTVDLDGMAARLAREAPAERSIVTEGSVSAPPA